MKQNPFSVYDFMGYFIPGALLLYLYAFINKFKHGSFDSILDDLSTSKGFQVDQIFFFVIVSYALGHIINFMSSMTVEKYALWRYDYPSKFLLGFDKKEYWGKNTKSGYLWRTLLPIMILPISFLDLIIGQFLNLKDVYTRKLDEFLIELIQRKGLVLINNLFGPGSKPQKIRDFDFFRVFAHYGFEYSKNHQTKLSNYVALYGFLRTMTLISVICFWYSIYSSYCDSNCNINAYYVFNSAIISYIFFMAFMKFYRRYTLEGLMIIAINEDIKVK